MRPVRGALEPIRGIGYNPGTFPGIPSFRGPFGAGPQGRQTGAFMDKIRIRGGRALTGAIPISGAKNAALPLMTASLLSDETLTLGNLPHLADIATLATLLAQHGVEIEMRGGAPNGGHTGKVLALTARNITSTTA